MSKPLDLSPLTAAELANVRKWEKAAKKRRDKRAEIDAAVDAMVRAIPQIDVSKLNVIPNE